jgi:hypothetical protein
MENEQIPVQKILTAVAMESKKNTERNVTE